MPMTGFFGFVNAPNPGLAKVLKSELEFPRKPVLSIEDDTPDPPPPPPDDPGGLVIVSTPVLVCVLPSLNFSVVTVVIVSITVPYKEYNLVILLCIMIYVIPFDMNQ